VASHSATVCPQAALAAWGWKKTLVQNRRMNTHNKAPEGTCRCHARTH
jgi:hypothetical protein